MMYDDVHRPHPEGDDPVDAILWDDCDRCARHAAEFGLLLDRANAARAWRKMVEVEIDYKGAYRSENERELCKRLGTMALFLERNARGIDVRYLLS